MSFTNEHQQRRKNTQENENYFYVSQCDQVSTDDEMNNDFYSTNSTPLKKMSTQFSSSTIAAYQYTPQFQIGKQQSSIKSSNNIAVMSKTTLNMQESQECYPPGFFNTYNKNFSQTENFQKIQFPRKNVTDTQLFSQSAQQEYQMPTPYYPQESQSQQKNKGEGLRLIQQSNDPNQVKYKTQICENWIKKGYCNYGNKCKFAHGIEDRKNLIPIGSNQFYKTRRCNQFFTKGFCTYGFRCHFQHEVRNNEEIQSQFLFQKYLNTFTEQNMKDLFQEKDEYFQDQSFSESTNEESSENQEQNSDNIFYIYNNNIKSQLKRLPIFCEIEQNNQLQIDLEQQQLDQI